MDFDYLNAVEAYRGQRLWQAVINRMAMDLRGRGKKLKAEAAQWFRLDNPSFRAVCDFAGYDAAYIYDRERAFIASVLPSVTAYEEERRKRAELRAKHDAHRLADRLLKNRLGMREKRRLDKIKAQGELV